MTKMLLIVLTLVSSLNNAQAAQENRTLRCVSVDNLNSAHMWNFSSNHNAQVRSVFRDIYNGLSATERAQTANLEVCISAPKPFGRANVAYRNTMNINFYIPNSDRLPEAMVQVGNLENEGKRNAIVQTMVENLKVLALVSGDQPATAEPIKISN